MRFHKKFVLILSGLVGLSLASSAIVYYNRNDAFVYVSMLWVAICILVVALSKANIRLWALYTGTAFFTFGCYEAYLSGWFSGQEPQKQLVKSSISNRSYFQPHPVLGVGPKKSTQVRAKKSYSSETLYDVQYTISEHGIRAGANTGKDSVESVLFFGGSFTFGEGVNDHEAMPYQFEKKAQGRYKAFNFGFHGYGPHQMTAFLEHGMEEDIIADHHPRYLVYQAIPGHINRSIGNSHWDQSGPKYVLNSQGEAVYSGAFRNWFVSKAIAVLARSNIIRRWLTANQKPSPEDIDLFVAIVDKAAKIFRARYGGEFYVLFWSGGSRLSANVVSKLDKKQIMVIEVETILPDVNVEKRKYRIHLPYEGHPNPLAYEIIAKYLVVFLEREESVPN